MSLIHQLCVCIGVCTYTYVPQLVIFVLYRGIRLQRKRWAQQ